MEQESSAKGKKVKEITSKEKKRAAASKQETKASTKKEKTTTKKAGTPIKSAETKVKKTALKSAKGPNSGAPSSTKKQSGINAIWIYGATAVLLLVIALLTISFTNSNTFSFKQKGTTVELWKGVFAPMGMRLVKIFPDLRLPLDNEGNPIIKDSYTKEEASDILFQHFLSKADETLSSQEAPDLKEINSFLDAAAAYALNDDAKKIVSSRKNGIRFLVLIGKINLALVRNIEEELIAAKQHLAEIETIAETPIQRQMAKEKASAIESALEQISSGNNK